MGRLTEKKILLGVSGGIAAYKSAELVRLLRFEGASVRVVMTASAIQFVGPLTFQALSGHPVHTELLDSEQESAMGHIHLSRWADLVLVAPATANLIAKIRLGAADDLLSTLCLASDVPVIVAPAMNRGMWENPATQENLACIRDRGIRILGPDQGAQACGEKGYGRMMEPDAICDQLAEIEQHGVLAQTSVLVTAGPTREAIDPVRFLSNHSSGKMGYAVAGSAKAAGAQVTLVSGPVTMEDPGVHRLIRVETAAEMYDQVVQRAADFDIFIAVAAVADYKPVVAGEKKIKKNKDHLQLSLQRTKDILGSVAALKNGPFTVGFAAETENLESYARKKLAVKSIDMIAANWVGRDQQGFNVDTNALEVFWPGGCQSLPLTSKSILAQQLVDLIAERFNIQKPTPA